MFTLNQLSSISEMSWLCRIGVCVGRTKWGLRNGVGCIHDLQYRCPDLRKYIPLVTKELVPFVPMFPFWVVTQWHLRVVNIVLPKNEETMLPHLSSHCWDLVSVGGGRRSTEHTAASYFPLFHDLFGHTSLHSVNKHSHGADSVLGAQDTEVI